MKKLFTPNPLKGAIPPNPLKGAFSHSKDVKVPFSGFRGLTFYLFALLPLCLLTLATCKKEDKYNPIVTITYHANGGSGTMEAQKFNPEEEGKLKTNTFAKTGSGFAGWATTADGSVVYQDNASTKIKENKTLYAKWNANNYTVTFEPDGGTVSPTSINVSYMSTYGILPTPTKTNHTFGGWFTQTNGQGTEILSTTQVTITQNQTLYAQWTALPTYTVTFHANGASGNMANQTFYQGIAQNLTANTFTRTNYTFAGWNTNAAGTGTNYTNQQSITISANMTLYAKWTANTYAVTFNGNGSTSGSMSDQTFTYGIAQNLTANTFTRTNYTFAGWNTNAAGTGTNYTNGQSITISANMTLYAQWTALPTYTVTFNSNGGSGTMANQTFYQGIAQALTANSFTRTNYTFAGWNTNAAGTGTNYTNQQSITISANMTLYAKWAANTYTVTFNGNGSTSGSMSNQTFTFGIHQYLTANSFTRTNYTFAGWNTNAAGTGTNYTNQQNITISANMTLYAKWTALPTYTVTFNSNGGSGTMANQTFYQGIAQNLTANTFTNSGQTITGWATTTSGSVVYLDWQSVTISANTTLYAKWSDTRCPGYPTITDCQGNVYNTVLIGTQCWTRENMKATKYDTNSERPNIRRNGHFSG